MGYAIMEALQFSSENEARFQDLLTRYPQKKAALIPALYLAQSQFGYLRQEVMEYVAGRLELPPSQVLNTASFYTMLHKKPVGTYQVEVCTNISCYLRGCDDIVDALKEELGLELGETSPEGLFTLSEVQCLAACGTAPALQVNWRYHENMTPKSAVELVRKLRTEHRGRDDA